MSAIRSAERRSQPIHQLPAAMGEPVRYLNRLTGRVEEEAIYGEGFLRWAYETTPGRATLAALVKRPVFSKWFGWRMSRATSRARIAPFIRNYGLDPAEFADPVDSFRHFNDFFIRRLKPDARPIAADPAAVFPADGRHFCLPCVEEDTTVFIKGQRFDVAALLGGDPKLAASFQGGALVGSRLCPVDYHRFHFPVAGTHSLSRLLEGPLFSVSPIALRRNLGYLWTNKRALTVIDSPAFGVVAIVEIGATCVGSIQQTHAPGTPIAKGAEKGFFAFGGSYVATLFQAGRITFADDLLQASAQGLELYAPMGGEMGMPQ